MDRAPGSRLTEDVARNHRNVVLTAPFVRLLGSAKVDTEEEHG